MTSLPDASIHSSTHSSTHSVPIKVEKLLISHSHRKNPLRHRIHLRHTHFFLSLPSADSHKQHLVTKRLHPATLSVCIHADSHPSLMRGLSHWTPLPPLTRSFRNSPPAFAFGRFPRHVRRRWSRVRWTTGRLVVHSRGSGETGDEEEGGTRGAWCMGWHRRTGQRHASSVNRHSNSLSRTRSSSPFERRLYFTGTSRTSAPFH